MAEQYTEVAEGLLGIADELGADRRGDQQPDPCSGKELMLYQTLQGGGIWQEMEPVGSIQRNFCGQCRKSLLSKIHCSEYRCDLCDLSQTAGLLCRGERR